MSGHTSAEDDFDSDGRPDGVRLRPKPRSTNSTASADTLVNPKVSPKNPNTTEPDSQKQSSWFPLISASDRKFITSFTAWEDRVSESANDIRNSFNPPPFGHYGGCQKVSAFFKWCWVWFKCLVVCLEILLIWCVMWATSKLIRVKELEWLGKLGDYEKARFSKFRFKSPRWYYLLRVSMVLIAVSFVLWKVWWLVIAPSKTMIHNFVIDPELRVVSLERPLGPYYVKDFIHDYSEAATWKKQVEILKMHEESLHTQLTANERRIMDEALQADDNDDSIPDIEQVHQYTVDMNTYYGVRYDNFGFAQEAHSDRPLLPLRPDGTLDPITPTPLNMCDRFGQYHHNTQSIIIKKGCHDINQYILDLAFNPSQRCRQIDNPTYRIAVEKLGKKALGLYNQEIKLCRNIIQEALARVKRHEERANPCVCSAHFGFTNLWAYSANPGFESYYLVDYEIQPMPCNNDTTVDVPGVPQCKLVWRHADDNPQPIIQQTNAALFDQLRLQRNILQPMHEIYLSAYVPVNSTDMSAYFGDTYGAVHLAIMNTRAKLFASSGNSRGSGGSDSNTNEELSAMNEITLQLFEERNNIHAARRTMSSREMLERAAKEERDPLAQNRLESALSIAREYLRFGQDTTYSSDDWENANRKLSYPQLQRVTLKIPPHHAACPIECKALHDLLDESRLNNVKKKHDPTFQVPQPPYGKQLRVDYLFYQ